MNRQSNMEKWAALYVRLSRDDENEGDSNSISHQIELLQRYCKERSITNCRVYKDDGFSGTSFNRGGTPGYKKGGFSGFFGTYLGKGEDETPTPADPKEES